MADSDTLQSMVDQTRRFVREELIPAEEWVEEHDDIPPHLIKMKELGYFGMTIAEEYGGLGLSMLEEVSVVAEIGSPLQCSVLTLERATVSVRLESRLTAAMIRNRNTCRASPSAILWPPSA